MGVGFALKMGREKGVLGCGRGGAWPSRGFEK